MSKGDSRFVWVLENNPENGEKWSPPLTAKEKKIIGDKSIDPEIAGCVISQIREANEVLNKDQDKLNCAYLFSLKSLLEDRLGKSNEEKIIEKNLGIKLISVIEKIKDKKEIYSEKQEEYISWFTENNPETRKKWKPPLEKEEKKAVIELVKTNNLSSVRIINKIRNASADDISNSQLLETMNYLENNWQLKDERYLSILRKNEISLENAAKNLRKKFEERKNEIFQELSEWSVNFDIKNLKLNCPSLRKLLSKKEYDSLKNSIIKTKLKDIEKNPKNWSILRHYEKPFAKPFVEVKRVGGDFADEETLEKKLFTRWEFIRVEQKLEGWSRTLLLVWLWFILTIILLIFSLFWLWKWLFFREN